MHGNEAGGNHMNVIRFGVGPMDNNVYLLADETSGEAAIIDPGFDTIGLHAEAVKRGLSITLIINTHAHLDHTACNADFARLTGAPLTMHGADVALMEQAEMQANWFGVRPPEVVPPTTLLQDGDRIAVGDGTVEALHTPGHSPGSVCLLGDGFVITGDVLFAGSIGRGDLPGGNMEQLLRSIRARLMVLPNDTIVYPGHGPTSTIGVERRTNPYL